MARRIPCKARNSSDDPREANPIRWAQTLAPASRHGRDGRHKQRNHQSMSTHHTVPPLVDPIAAFVSRRVKHKERPELLEAIAIDVTVRGGLALVETRRTYHNTENKPIEALLTLPVPVQAAFFGLTARVGDRQLTGIAQKREKARETYEDAVDEGKTAVLHEELLRGVHLLSVANLAAGAEVEVTMRWAEVLRCRGNHGRLRIPMTVGDVYGSSGLLDVDELTHGGKALSVQLRVRHDAGSIKVGAAAPKPAADGMLSIKVPSNRPIDLQVNNWKPGVLHGQGHHGKPVSLRIEPAGDGDENLDVAVLVDRSGSMSSPCSTDRGIRESVHVCVRRALLGLPEQLRPADRVALWQFDNRCEPLGTGLPVPPDELAKLVDDLNPPRGGTEIGKAIERVIRADSAPDLLLITDGLSYALDVQKLARKGRRVFAVLVGEQSLEANVGHLAALTGGDVHFSYGKDISTALRDCVEGLRSKGERTRFTGGAAPKQICALRGNTVIDAWWDVREEPRELDMFSGAVAAYAAGLALGSMNKAAATQLAVREGLVTHLTSLVLVDEQGARSQELPLTRKIKLSTPPTADSSPRMMLYSKRLASKPALPARRAMRTGELRAEAMHSFDAAPLEPPSIERVARSIDWNKHGNRLGNGVLDGIDPEAARFIHEHAQRLEIREAAGLLETNPVFLVLLCLAGLSAPDSEDAECVRQRLAEHVVRAIPGTLIPQLGPVIQRALVERVGRGSAINRVLIAQLEPAIHRTLLPELESLIQHALYRELVRSSAFHKALLAELQRDPREY